MEYRSIFVSQRRHSVLLLERPTGEYC